jgi:hypothetical protein
VLLLHARHDGEAGRSAWELSEVLAGALVSSPSFLPSWVVALLHMRLALLLLPAPGKHLQHVLSKACCLLEQDRSDLWWDFRRTLLDTANILGGRFI